MSEVSKSVIDRVSSESEWTEFNETAHNLFFDIEIDLSSDLTKTIDIFDCEMNTKSDFQIEKLKGGENFYDWQFQMENYLAMKGYSDCIVKKSAAENVPKETGADKLSAAKGMLVLSMETALHPHIRKCKSALEIWQTLEKLFEDRGHLRKTDLLQKLVTNKLEDCDSMTTYIGNIMTTIAKLENIGLTVGEDWTVAFLLVGLGKNFESFKMGLGANIELKSDELKTKLMELDEGKGGEALYTKHAPNKNQKGKNQRKKKRNCFKCNSTLHLQRDCPEKNKNQQKKNAKTDENANSAFCAIHAFNATSPESESWYIDSGASRHMTPDDGVLKNKQKCDVAPITAADNKKMQVKSYGETIIEPNGKPIEVKNVFSRA